MTDYEFKFISIEEADKICNGNIINKCLTCEDLVLNNKKDVDYKYCRKCYLTSRGMSICQTCNSTKKDNNFKICFKCSEEMKNKIRLQKKKSNFLNRGSRK